MPPWDWEISALGPPHQTLFHKLGDCFKIVYWLHFKRKKSSVCMVVFLFHTQLQFLVIFDLLFSRNGNSWEAVVSISSRSSKLYLIRDECDLVL